MNLTREEMIRAAEDLRIVNAEGLLDDFAAGLVERLREELQGSRSSQVSVLIESDFLVRKLTAFFGGDQGTWRHVVSKALGGTDRSRVGLDLLRDMANAARATRARERQRRNGADTREERMSPHGRPGHLPEGAKHQGESHRNGGVA